MRVSVHASFRSKGNDIKKFYYSCIKIWRHISGLHSTPDEKKELKLKLNEKGRGKSGSVFKTLFHSKYSTHGELKYRTHGVHTYTCV